MCWVCIAFFKLWNTGINVFLTPCGNQPQGRNSRMVRSVLDILPANLSLSMCKNRPKASYSRSFPWGFKNTVLSYLHSHSTFPSLWFLNFDNTYSSLRYTHYCRDGCVQAVPHLCSFPGMAGIIKDLGRQWKVIQSKLKEDIKDLLKAPTDQGNLKKSPKKKKNTWNHVFKKFG